MKRQHLIIIMTVAIGIALLTPSYGSVKATWNGVYDVKAPTAKNTTAWNYAYGVDRAKKLDGLAMNLGSWGYVRTSDFTDPSYADFLPFYGNRSDFPSVGDAILHVHLFWYVYAPPTSYYKVYLEQEVNGSGYTTIFTTPTFYGTGLWNQWEYHVNETVAWTASKLINSTMFRVTLMVQDGGGNVFVDYVGFYYQWTEGIPVYDEEENPITSLNPIQLIGVTGFIGMIGVPAASIWFFRRDGGSKIMIAVSALVAFTVCFGLFLGSINGG